MNTPSLKTLRAVLNVDRQTAIEAKAIMNGSNCHLSQKLGLLNRLLEMHGIEYAAHRRDSFARSYGLEYLNAGDTYAGTVIYDHSTGRFHVATVGDFLECPRKGKGLI